MQQQVCKTGFLKLLFAASFAAGSLFAVGCVVQSAPSGGSAGGGGTFEAPPPSLAAAPSSAEVAPGLVGALVVDLDPDRTLIASPGQGVGVFAEYQTGGHWRLFWTCDTEQTRAACDYEVDVRVPAGAIANVDALTAEPGDVVAQPSPTALIVKTRTTTDASRITFDTTPGANIELGARMTPQPASTFLFFVQDGKVNGGYTGPLTNPLILHPSAP